MGCLVFLGFDTPGFVFLFLLTAIYPILGTIVSSRRHASCHKATPNHLAAGRASDCLGLIPPLSLTQASTLPSRNDPAKGQRRKPFLP